MSSVLLTEDQVEKEAEKAESEKARSENLKALFQKYKNNAMQASLREARQEKEASACDIHSVQILKRCPDSVTQILLEKNSVLKRMREEVQKRRAEKAFLSEGADKNEKCTSLPSACRNAKAAPSKRNKKA
jgi:hypothetical protein